MPSKWAFIILGNLMICAIATIEDENTRAFIQLTELAYEDTCSDTSEAEWVFVNSPSNETLLLWEEKLISYATFKNIQRFEIANNSEDAITDPSLQYKYNVAEKVGDALLNNEDFKTFVHFAGTAELLRLSIHEGSLNNYTRKDVERILSYDSSIENKSSIWSSWHQDLVPLVKNFSITLSLADKAAKANDAKNIAEYWELLSGYSDGYDNIRNEWNSNIKNLHGKILNFAKSCLSQKYNISMNDAIPAYLLGSLQASDWTPISIDISPYPDLMYKIEQNLWEKKLIGKSLYKVASAMSSQILSKVPEANFWEESNFDQQCPAKLINFCKDAIMRVSTCFEPTVSNFITAHKNVAKVVFNQLSIENTPILNMANRYSALEEGVSELFGILAASPAWLNRTYILDNSTDNEKQMVSLMITALNILPRIAYYMSVDSWRINAIEKQMNVEDLVSSWWSYRQEYEGLDSNETNLPTFLNDDYITSNKPYLPKFVGIVLGFQLYQYLMDSTEVRQDSIMGKQIDIKFLKMIQEGNADDWMKIMDKYLEMDEVSSDALLSFFSPLEDFIEELDDECQYKPIAARELELEQLEKKIMEEINAPPTTTTVTVLTTTSAARNLTNQPKPTRSKVVVSNSTNNLEPKSDVESTTEVSSSGTTPEPKISKAVWAVSAVLLATVVIVIIAIFGRRRCRKTPKNRRYV